MPNIKFNYLYRDGANYKNYNSVIFSNPTDIDLVALETIIKSKLIYGEWFYADDWKLPDLFFDHCDYRIDPTWHEFESVEYTDEPINGQHVVVEFMALMDGTNWIY